MNDKAALQEQAQVTCATRRYIEILRNTHEQIKIKLTPRFGDIAAGDQVLVDFACNPPRLIKLLDRQNQLTRTYRKRSKLIAANLDRILIVTAVGPLFNTIFIDRVLTAATVEGIPCTLLVNKVDLGLTQSTSEITVYQQIGIDLILMSAATGQGIDQLTMLLANQHLKRVVLAGVSGVGKSTILNRLVLQAQRRTAEVSRKTGLGRQTTSLAIGYRYDRGHGSDLLLIDLPGIQTFGVTDLDPLTIASTFPEFCSIQSACEYRDCHHLEEPNCAVRDAVFSGEIPCSRYESYLNMVSEVESARPY